MCRPRHRFGRLHPPFPQDTRRVTGRGRGIAINVKFADFQVGHKVTVPCTPRVLAFCKTAGGMSGGLGL